MTSLQDLTLKAAGGSARSRVSAERAPARRPAVGRRTSPAPNRPGRNAAERFQ